MRLAAAVGLAMLLGVAFADVLFRGRTLTTSAYSGSVMGQAPPYGYPAARPQFDMYLLDPGASAWQYEPFTAKASRRYRSGRLPLWNASQGFGAPLAADMHSSVFYLPALPLLLAPSPVLWDAYLLARLLAAGMLTFLLVRSIGGAPLGAFGAGAAFMLSGYLLLWVNNSWLNVDVLAPALLYAIERHLRRPSRGTILLVAATVSGTILGGMPESAFVVLLFALAYALFRLASVRREVGWHAARAQGLSLAVVGTLGAGTSALLLVPFAEYVRNGWDLHTTTGAFGLGHVPLRTMLALVAPYVDGPPLATTPSPTCYAGATVVALAAVGLAARDVRRRAMQAFFLIATVVALLKTHGLLINAIGALPVFDLVNYPKHLGVVVCLSLAVLAGVGLDAIAAGRVTVARALVATVVVLAAGAGLLLAHGPVAKPAGRAAIGCAAALVVGLQVALLFAGGPRRPLAAGCCVVLMLLELLVLAPRSERPLRHPADAMPPSVDFVRRDGEPYRILGLDGVLYPNTASFFDLQDVRAVDALYPARYVRYVEEFLNPAEPLPGGLYSGIIKAPPRCLDNPWFDLLGVRYVLAPAMTSMSACEGLISRLVLRSAGGPGVRASSLTIGGVEKPLLLQHPPSEIVFPVRPAASSRFLSFSIALDPDVWAPGKGDGVSFEVAAVSDGRRTPLFTRWLDPKNDPRDRRWLDGSVDLAPYLGRDIELVLATQPGASSAWDWAGWGDLRWTDGRAPESAPQYSLVWGGDDRTTDMKVYRNRQAFPRAFIVHAAEPVADEARAIRRMREQGFDPARTVVLELPTGEGLGLVPSVAAADLRAETVDILRYEDARVMLRVDTARPGVLVLTDVFYPGWSARINGRSTTIYPANLAFRGVVVPAGTHVVDFAYRPWSFVLGLALSLASMVALAVLVRRA